MNRFVFLCVLSSTVFLFSCSGSKENQTELPEKVNPSFYDKVLTVQSTLCNQEKEITLTGKVVTDPDKTIHYAPLVSGIVERIYFSLGDKVEKGQTLMDLRSADLSALHAEHISLKTEILVAERELKSAQELYDDNMLSERELLEAKSRLIQAQTSYRKIQDNMALFGTNKGDGSFSLKAPISGYIIEKNISAGSTVSVDGGALFTIADLNKVWIIANVYAGDLRFVKEGMDVDISTLSYPNEILTGKIDAVSQVFDPEDKTLKARVIMQNSDLKLKPEMSTVVRLKDKNRNNLVCIPSEALIFDNDLYYVVIRQNNNFSVQEVKLHDHHGNITYLSSGLPENEEVVIKNQLLIYSELKGI